MKPNFQMVVGIWVPENELIVIGTSRDDFRDCELGLSFDGRMIYDYDKLAEAFANRDFFGDYLVAEEWIAHNVSCDPRVLVVSS